MLENENGWKLKKELSLGDLLAIAIAMLSIVSVYFKIDTRVSMLENKEIDRKESVAKIETKMDRKFDQIDSKLDRLLEVVMSQYGYKNGAAK